MAPKTKNKEEEDLDNILNFINDPEENPPTKNEKKKNKRRNRKKKGNNTENNQKLETNKLVLISDEEQNLNKDEIEEKTNERKKESKKSKPKAAIAAKLLQRKKRLEKARKKQLKEELERQKQEREEEEARLAEEEIRLAKVKAKRQAKKEKIAKAKKEGTYLTPTQLKKKQISELKKEKFILSKKVENEYQNSEPNKTKNLNKKKRSEFNILTKEDPLNTVKNDDQIEMIDKKESSVDQSDSLSNWEDASYSDSEDHEKTVKNIKVPPENKTSSKTVDNSCIKERLVENKTSSKPVKKVIENSDKVKDKKNNNDSIKNKICSKNELRSPICCVLGHVDTGKTKLLDRMRKTSVQDNEVGGITQQIGASFFPRDFVVSATSALSTDHCKLPGLLIIDTPGHESFSNLRQRGSSLCDIAILVVDIMHGVEPQTAESVKLLRGKKTPFVIALNKIDKIFEWNSKEGEPFVHSFKRQKESQKSEFRRRLKESIAQISALGLNCALYSENPDVRSYVSMVPTSAMSGEGIPDLLHLIVTLTQTRMAAKLKLSDKTECSVLEVRVEEGLGYTADVILSNGSLCTGDRIVVGGLNGPIDTVVKSLYEPSALKETRFRGEFKKVRRVRASSGVKICAQDLDQAVAGSALFVCKNNDDIELLKNEVMADYAGLLSKMEPTGNGVCVQSSTLGSLEAFLNYLADEKIPVTRIALGPVHKKDVMAASVMVDKKPQFACILAFNVKIDRETKHFAESLKVKIFQGEIIYNLRDMFVDFIDQFKKAERTDNKKVIIPVSMTILPEFIIMKHNPIIIGCQIDTGRLVVGTPLVALEPKKHTKFKNTEEENFVSIGVVESIEMDKKKVTEAKPRDKVAVKIVPTPAESHVYYGRQFDSRYTICSFLSRDSIDKLKEDYKDIMTKEDWRLVIRLKKIFGIV